MGRAPDHDLQPRPVDLWSPSLRLAPKTRGHIRGLLHIIWDYAMWSGLSLYKPIPSVGHSQELLQSVPVNPAV